jgi:hypothetical protein
LERTGPAVERSQCSEWFPLVVRLGAPYLPIEQTRVVAVVWRDSLACRRKEAALLLGFGVGPFFFGSGGTQKWFVCNKSFSKQK